MWSCGPDWATMGAVGKVLAAIGTAAAIAAQSAPALAQDAAPAAEEGARGFGERGSVLFGIENVFGVLDQTYTASNNGGGAIPSFNDNGFFPQGLVGTRLSLHGLLSSGITLGGIMSVWNATATGQGNSSLTAFDVGPRIGYAACLKKYKALGFWGRVGPTFQYATDSAGSSSQDIWTIDLSFEAFLVWSPVDHFGLLAGPSVDIGIAGHESPSQGNGYDAGYHSVGMSFGLVFEL